MNDDELPEYDEALKRRPEIRILDRFFSECCGTTGNGANEALVRELLRRLEEMGYKIKH